MITNFQKRKLVNLFHIHDLNSNGVLESSDFAEKTNRLATVWDWAPGSEPHKALGEGFSRFWEGLKSADTNGDGVVSYEEWWAWWDNILTNGLYDQVAKPIGAMIFSMCDPEQTGLVSEANFLRFYLANTGNDGREIFAHMDTKGSGHLTLEQLNTCLHEFFFSNERTAPGNWIFGRI